jgi:hypothetical protein
MPTVSIAGIIKAKVDDFAASVCRGYANQAEEYAKENRPWEDRTPSAKPLLTGYVVNNGEWLGFGIAHRVGYGPDLELGNDGRYAILRPTIEHFKNEFLKTAEEFF